MAGGGRRVCVSIASDDGETVKLGHFGDARWYLHYVYEDGGWRLVRRVENPYRGEHEHHHHRHGGEGEEEEHGGKREKIYMLNRECDAIVATAFGPGGGEYMERRGLRVFRVKPRTRVEEALRMVEEALGLRG